VYQEYTQTKRNHPLFAYPLENPSFIDDFGGREGIRTLGLLVANEALSQLSYSPTSHWEL
jgi:hypothetical protein